MVEIITLTNPLHLWLVAQQGNLIKCSRTASMGHKISNNETMLCYFARIQYWIQSDSGECYTYEEKIWADDNGTIKFDGSLFKKLVDAGFKIELSNHSGAF